MKNRLSLFITLLPFLLFSHAEAFDVKGLQPVAPFGVFSTFSAESLKQNEVAFNMELERSVGPNFYRTTLKGAYGLHDSFEILFSLPYVFVNQNGGDGMEDPSFGVIHRLVDETDYLPAFAYLLTVSASSDVESISTNGRVGGGLLFTKKVGPFKGHLNLLYIVPQRHELNNEYDINIGSELAITHSTKILAELVGRKDFFKNKLDFLEWRLGCRISNGNNVFTTLGAGFNIENRSPDLRLLFSVGVVLPFQKAKIQRIYEE